ncbi:unnamed protein product [Prunus armeniaca]|uniref:Uncharacterized protein n=1 Tax=Prunus armeniaca TaxID=36596 RepID=A0A6J5XMY0_PRUAR|nr:unnamed protein product [Prunus armeniaca]
MKILQNFITRSFATLYRPDQIGTRASPGLKHFSKPPMEVLKFLILLLFAATVDWSEAGLPSLRQGSSLKVEEESDFLVSPNGTFSSGFYKLSGWLTEISLLVEEGPS